MRLLSKADLYKSLRGLEEQLAFNGASAQLVACGGSALIALDLVRRTTKDVDIVASITDGVISSATPFSPSLIEAIEIVAEELGLPNDWLNSGPAELFSMGLPDGFQDRLTKEVIGDSLTMYFISRLDQIFFKLYASVDRGGYHISDLEELRPTKEEIYEAAKWSMTHDVSEGYRYMLCELLNQLGFSDVASRI